ncbi:MAG: hypothetical protein DDT21_02613 [Syntrophomonadaceae bacterium]|nr:hypothetical protein [Bacillota bacterium]
MRRGISGAAHAGAASFGKMALEEQQAEIQAERDRRIEEMREGASIRAEGRAAQAVRDRETHLRERDKADSAAIRRIATLSEANQAMAGITGSPTQMTEADIETLRQHPEAVEIFRQRGAKGLLDSPSPSAKAEAAASIGRLDLQQKYQGEAERAAAGARSDRQFDEERRRADRQFDEERRRADRQFDWQNTQAGIDNRRADLAAANAARRLKLDDARDVRADEAGRRQAVVSLLNDTAAQIREITAALAGAMLNPEATKLYENQLAELTRERDSIRRLLGGLAGLPTQPQRQAPPGTSKVATEAQLIAYARDRGISVEEARKQARAEGYEVPEITANPARQPTQPVVAGRPFYYTPRWRLERMAKDPIGVSTAEANDARAELKKRVGEARMRAF